MYFPSSTKVAFVGLDYKFTLEESGEIRKFIQKIIDLLEEQKRMEKEREEEETLKAYFPNCFPDTGTMEPEYDEDFPSTRDVPF